MKTQTIKFSLLLALLVIIASCNEAKRAIKKDQKAIAAARASFDKHPEIFAEACAVRFPVRVSDSTPPPVITYKTGGGDTVKNTTVSDQTNNIIDLLQRKDLQHVIDSLKQHPYIVKADCPPIYVPYPDTIEIKQSHYKTLESQDLATALRLKNDSLLAQSVRYKSAAVHSQALYEQMRGKYRILKWGLIAVAVAMLIYAIIKFR